KLLNSKGKVLATGTAKEGKEMNHTISVEHNDLGRKNGFRILHVDVVGEAKIPPIVSNPRWMTPAIDYDFRFTISGPFKPKGGMAFTHLKYAHDGFPNYEVFARFTGGKWAKVYQYDHIKAGNGPGALAGWSGRQEDAWNKIDNPMTLP